MPRSLGGLRGLVGASNEDRIAANVSVGQHAQIAGNAVWGAFRASLQSGFVTGRGQPVTEMVTLFGAGFLGQGKGPPDPLTTTTSII